MRERQLSLLPPVNNQRAHPLLVIDLTEEAIDPLDTRDTVGQVVEKTKINKKLQQPLQTRLRPKTRFLKKWRETLLLAAMRTSISILILISPKIRRI
jgi:hypothetical protein